MVVQFLSMINTKFYAITFPRENLMAWRTD